MVPMNLQMFAEEAEAETSADTAVEAPAEKVSFDDFLKDGDNKKEYDSRLSKAVKSELRKAEKKWKALADEKTSEAEKLALMTQDEKVKYQANKREAELSKREAELNKRELQSTAKGKLVEAGLPADLYTVLDYTDADACDGSIQTLSEAFQRAVETAVAEKLKGTEPPKSDPAKSQNSNTSSLDQQIYNAMKGW